VALRYRRSLLGPWWLTLSTGVMVVAIGLVYGDIFKVDLHLYLPYLTVSLLVWGLISASISEGCQTFIEADSLIRQISLPLLMFPLRVVWRNLIIFLHNLVIFPVIILFFPVEIGWSTLAALAGLFLLVLNAFSTAILLGMLSARFRDLPQIVSSLLQVAFFATPIVWNADLISSKKKMLVFGNPFYHLLEVVRAPLLGHPPLLLNWVVVGAITICMGSVALGFYRRFWQRIAYWV
jgi:ABC-type polysaccharide/polyol phosphate export permease